MLLREISTEAIERVLAQREAERKRKQAQAAVDDDNEW